MRKISVLFLIMLPAIISCETHVNIKPSPEPTVSSVQVTPTPVITSTPEQTPVPTPSPAESVTPIIESNMEEIITESPKPTLPPVEKLPSVYRNGGRILGTVYNEKHEPMPDALVSLNIYSDFYKDKESFFGKYDYYNSIVTDSFGHYDFYGPNGMIVIITIQKEDFTKINQEVRFEDAGRQITESNFILTKTPEIQRFKINGNKIERYDFIKVGNIFSKEKRQINGSFIKLIVVSDIKIPRFKLESVNNLKIELNFNRVINRKSLEENIFIESLDKSIIYSNKTNSATFHWSDNDKKVIFHVPIVTKSEDIIYRLGFKEPFTDTEGIKPFEGEIFNTGFIYTELSENIVFAVAGGQ